jgi:predicted RNA-binding protein
LMCEFKVFLDGEKVAEDIVYAKIEGDQVTIRDILGRFTVFESTSLDELNVMTTRLLLSRVDNTPR